MRCGAGRPAGRWCDRAAAQPVPHTLVGGYGVVIEDVRLAQAVGAQGPEQAEVRAWAHGVAGPVAWGCSLGA